MLSLQSSNEILNAHPTDGFLVMQTSTEFVPDQTAEDRFANSRKIICDMVTLLEVEAEKNINLQIKVDGNVIPSVRKFKVLRMQDPKDTTSLMKIRFASFVPVT